MLLQYLHSQRNNLELCLLVGARNTQQRQSFVADIRDVQTTFVRAEELIVSAAFQAGVALEGF